MSRLVVRLLGAPQFEYDGELITPTQRKPIALLAYLALTGQPQRRDTLAALLWPNLGQRQARANLRHTLWQLGQTRLSAWLRTDAESVDLHAGDNVWVDVNEFQALLADLRKQAGSGSADMVRLQAAAELVRGEFLVGFTLDDSAEFDEWQFFQTERLRRESAWVLERLVDRHEQADSYPEAITCGLRWLALDPLAEPIHRRLMRLYAAGGQRTAALRQYQGCIRLLEQELGIPPEEETTALYEAIRLRRFPETGATTQGQGDDTDNDSVSIVPITPPQRAAPSPLHNLPPQMTSFVGREGEIQEILRLQRDPHCRLLTIAGAGGVGKTRLAIIVGEQVLGLFPDGVFFVPLVGTAKPEHLSAAIVEALEPHIDGTGNSRDRLLNFVSARHLLLILDNYEHLSAGASFLAELLARAPRLKLLVTSRERLNLQEEWSFGLEGLPYPDTAGSPIESTHTAIALFAQRARQMRPDFSLDAEAEGVAAICRLVGGVPLGIELAATWVRLMSCAEIATELSRDFDFLRSPLQNLPPQHRSLRAVFERSWSLLTAEDQVALRRLAVFRGGFDPAAAEAVAGADACLLARLVDRSLVRRQPARSGRSRFDLHELLRQFAAEKLADAPQEREEAYQRHGHYYSRWLSDIAWPLERSDKPREIGQYTETCRQIAADMDNVRAAWQWAVRQRDPAAIRQAMDVLAYHYFNSLEAAEARQVFDEAVASFQTAAEMPEAEKLHMCGLLLLRKGYSVISDNRHRDQTAQTLTQSLVLLRRSNAEDRFDIAMNLILLGQCLSTLGRKDEATACADEGLALFRELAHPMGLGWALYNRALLEMAEGRLKAAAALFQESRSVTESSPNRYWASAADVNLGVVYMAQGRYVQSRELLARALANQPHASGAPFCLRQLGDLATATGDFEQAEHHFAAAAAQMEYFGIGWQIDQAFLLSPGALARLQRDFVNAERLLLRSVATAREVGFFQRLATSLYNLSRLRYDQGRYTEAKELLDEALDVAQRIGFQIATAFVLCQLGHVTTALDQPNASRYYADALRIALDQEIDRAALEALIGVATHLARRGDVEPAVGLLALAQTHPAGEYETKRSAQRLLTELEPRLSPADFALAVEMGRQADLRAVVLDLLSRTDSV